MSSLILILIRFFFVVYLDATLDANVIDKTPPPPPPPLPNRSQCTVRVSLASFLQDSCHLKEALVQDYLGSGRVCLFVCLFFSRCMKSNGSFFSMALTSRNKVEY